MISPRVFTMHYNVVFTEWHSKWLLFLNGIVDTHNFLVCVFCFTFRPSTACLVLSKNEPFSAADYCMLVTWWRYPMDEEGRQMKLTVFYLKKLDLLIVHQCAVWIQLEEWVPAVMSFKSELVDSYMNNNNYYFISWGCMFMQSSSGPMKIESITIWAIGGGCSDGVIDYQITWAVKLVDLHCMSIIWIRKA